jgi:hypothetical protein
MTGNILSRYGMGHDPYAWRSNMDAQPDAPPNILSQGPAPTGYDRVRDAIYNALGGQPQNAWAANKLATMFDLGTLGMATGAYDGGRELAHTGDPNALAMALMPGMKPVGAAAKAARNIKINQLNHGTLTRNNEAGYAPPELPQREFNLDYKRPHQGDIGSRLETDMDGRPLIAEHVAGRRTVGGNDEALTPDEATELANYVSNVVRVRRDELPSKSVGSYTPRDNKIKIADDLPDDQASIALAHELGHAIDTQSQRGVVFADKYEPRAKKIYHDLRTGNVAETRPSRMASPETDGYKLSDRPGELSAEFIRAYLTNPNYVKSIAPELAKQLRALINADRGLSKYIQFNALAPTVIGGATAARAASSDEDFEEILRKYGLLPPAALGDAAIQDPAQQ